MKAILIEKDEARSLIWSDVPDPVLQPEEVLLRVEYAALNRADLMQREGDYPPPPGAPEWMGLEVSGTVAALGAEAAAASDWKIGDRVCALLGGGGYAEYVAARYDVLMPVPDGCTMAEAAAMPEAFCTAYLNLFWEGKAHSGDTLLMHAGGSGLASVTIPMAKAFGLRVITTIRDEGKRAAVEKLGPDIVVNTKTEDLVSVLDAELAAGGGVDVAIDCLGGMEMGKCLTHLKRGARWIMIASMAGPMTEIDLKNIYVRNVRIIGSTLRSRPPEVKAELIACLVREVWPKVETGLIRPTVYEILPVVEADAAQQILYRGENVGKVVLRVR